MFDVLTGFMLIAVLFIGLNIILYSSRYLLSDLHQQRFQAQLSLLIFSVTLLILSGNLFTVFISWQFIGISLYLLLNHYHYDVEANRSAKKKFMINRIGDIAFLIALILCYQYYHSTEYQYLFSHSHHFNKIILVLISIAIMTKSAQFPFHIWLIDTMEAPTPVSALMHAGVVNSGGFLLARLSPLYSQQPSILVFLFIIGLITALIGQWLIRYQYDIKKRLAYSTMAQMGFMILQCGIGSFISAVFHLISHGLFKSMLFLNSNANLNTSNVKSKIEGKRSLILSVLLTIGFVITGYWIFYSVLNPLKINFLSALFITVTLFVMIHNLKKENQSIAILLLYFIFLTFLYCDKEFHKIISPQITNMINQDVNIQKIILAILFVWVCCIVTLKLKFKNPLLRSLGYYKFSVETSLRTFGLNFIRLIGEELIYRINKFILKVKIPSTLVTLFGLVVMLILNFLYFENTSDWLNNALITFFSSALLLMILVANRLRTLNQLIHSISCIVILVTILLYCLTEKASYAIAFYYLISHLLLIVAFINILKFRHKQFANNTAKVHIKHNQLPLCHFYFSLFLLMMIGIPGTSSFIAELFLLKQILQSHLFTLIIVCITFWMLALMVLHALQVHFFNPNAINLYAVKLPLRIHLFSIGVIVFNLIIGLYPQLFLTSFDNIMGVLK